MERWVAIVLGLLVVVVGFLVVQNIMDGTDNISDTGSDVECIVNGGSCVEGSCDEPLSYSCGGERTCCQVS